VSGWWQLLVSVIFGLAVNECCDLSPWMARKIVRLAAKLAYPDPERIARRAEEWEAVIVGRPGKLFKLTTALGFLLGALGLLSRRSALAGVTKGVFAACDAIITVTPNGPPYRAMRLVVVLLRIATFLGSRSARWRLGEVLDAMGHGEQAQAVWRTAAADERAARWFFAGRLRATGHISEAIEVWRMAIDAGDPGAWHELAALSRASAGLLAAMHVWEEAVVADEPMARSGLADILDAMGRVDEAIALRVQSVEAGEPGAEQARRTAWRGVPGQSAYGCVEHWVSRNARAVVALDEIHSEDIPEALTPREFMDVSDEQWRLLSDGVR
jgi:tetratricopeptide (TPR) repeat protein